MLQKYRLCFTVALVFAVMAGFIQFLEADKNRYHTSLFGNLNASLGIQTKQLKPSVIRFVPKDATKIVIISEKKEPVLEKRLNEEKQILTTQLLGNTEVIENTIYTKTKAEAATAHRIMDSIRKSLPKGRQNIKISDFETFEQAVKSKTYFQSGGNETTFIDYQTILEDADLILWIGRY